MNRNYGIDLFRIVSMLMVVVLHTLGHGGVLASTSGINYWIAWFIEISCYCAVNCYALISGYVGIQSRYKISNGLYIWLQAIFYTSIITILFILSSPALFSGKLILSSVLPVITNQYWYLTAYIGLFLFIPLLNHAINHMNKNQLTNIIISLIFVFSILPTLRRADLFKMDFGYSVIWLMILYIIGGYVKLYGFPFIDTKIKGIFIYIGCVFFTVFSKYLLKGPIYNVLGISIWEDMFITYLSPTILFSSLGLLIFFSKLDLNKKIIDLVKFVAPSTFGVYLIHEFPLIRAHFITNKFIDYANKNFVMMILLVFITALSIFTICVLIDHIRLLIFNKLKIKEKLIQLENKLIEYNKA